MKDGGETIESLSKQSVKDIILHGLGYAYAGDIKTIDEILSFALQKKIDANIAMAIDNQCYILPTQFLKDDNPNIRLYGAALAVGFFGYSHYNDPSIFTELRKDLEEYLKKVAYDDKELVRTRFFASVALFKSEISGGNELKLISKTLTENLYSGIIEDPELGIIAKIYINYAKEKYGVTLKDYTLNIENTEKEQTTEQE